MLWLSTSRLRGEHGFERAPFAAKIGNQYFHAAIGNAAANLLDRARENGSAAIRLIVTIYGSDDGVAQAHFFDCFRDALGFIFFGRSQRLAGRYRAKAARAGADVAEDHECGGAMFPAFAHVGAARAFTDGMQAKRAHQALELLVIRSAEETHLEPVGPRMHVRRRCWREEQDCYPGCGTEMPFEFEKNELFYAWQPAARQARGRRDDFFRAVGESGCSHLFGHIVSFIQHIVIFL